MKTKISVVANLWVKSMRFEAKGESADGDHVGHKHKFPHQTILAFGVFKVTVDGLDYVYDASEEERIVYIEAGKIHKISSMSDVALAFCVHPIRDGEEVEDIVDPADMPLVGGQLLQPLIEG